MPKICWEEIATYIVCVNFRHEWRDLKFKADSDCRIFEKLFMAIFYLLSQFVIEINREEVIKEIFFHIFFFMSVLEFGPGSSHNQLANDNFQWFQCLPKIDRKYLRYCTTYALKRIVSLLGKFADNSQESSRKEEEMVEQKNKIFNGYAYISSSLQEH